MDKGIGLKNRKANQYMIALHKWRSVMALIACTVSLVCTAVAVCGSIVLYVKDDAELSELFRYFTTLSNIITALASAFIIPFAINGIRLHRFVYPKWLSLLHYSGTICTTLTFVFAFAFILPTNRELAIGGYNTYLHVVCPLAVLISFEMVEDNYKFSKKDMFLCLTPFIIYSLVYLVMVVFTGKWEDMYMITYFVPAYVSLPAMWLLALGVAFTIRKLTNALIQKRQKKITAAFDEREYDKVELNIEVFGLGRFYGHHDDEDDLSVPYDILDTLAKKYSLNVYDLLQIYNKGLIDGVKERKE